MAGIDNKNIQEGKRKIDRKEYKLTENDHALEYGWYYWQKNNRNPDGTDNMKWSKEWGRFNQCFISTTTACGNALLDWLEAKGEKRKTTGYFHEFSTLIVLEDKGERFLWSTHRDFINENLEAAFPGKKYRVNFSTITRGNMDQKIKRAIDEGRQPWLGIKFGQDSGHLSPVIGYREKDDRIVGLWLADPAGVLTKGYNLELDGFMSYIPESMFDSILRGNRQFMDLVS